MRNGQIFGKVPISINTDGRLTFSDLRVYAALASFQGGDESCWPSLKAISGRSRVHVSHISNCTRKLRDLGYLEITRTGKRQSNVYRVKCDCAISAISPESDYASSAQIDYAKPAYSSIKQQGKEEREAAKSAATPSGIQNEAKAFLRHFADEHERVTGNKYSLVPSKDLKLVVPHIKALGAEETTQRASRYLASTEPYIVNKGYPLALFLNQINSYGDLHDRRGGSRGPLKMLTKDEPSYM